MATLKAVIIPAKVLKNGQHKIRISVAHSGETRYIVTDIMIDSEKEFKSGAVVRRPDASFLNTKLRGLLQRYQETIDEIEFASGLSCAELICQIKNAGNYKRRTLASICEEYFENSIAKKSSQSSYLTAWNTIKQYININMLVANINFATIAGLDKALRIRGLKGSTIHNYLVFFKALINYAKKCGYVQYRVDPFNGYKFPDLEVRDSWLSVSEIRSIRDAKIESRKLQKCRDIFMLSYYLGGINIVDLLKIDFNKNSKVLHYVRQKTEDRPKQNKFVEFKIPEEALPIINKYKGADGIIKVSEGQTKDRLHSFFNHYMPKLGDVCGVKRPVYYSARKSFSQHAFLLGINTAVIDYILGHRVDKSGHSIYAYVRVTPAMATKAVREVLDDLK